ncbi:unnamed protein product [Mytilus edulis]|uniref:Dynein heavy chain coiled coil stalk domain-containing protein n=1 Tax=Mytilus edulis TaxID=6550 RepID=A0A8S3PMP6_MYTED|nr:unnamed protein product [Mytilus edulis]
MSKKFGGKKKGGKAFGKFGNVSDTDSSENGLSFGKAWNTFKNIQLEHNAANSAETSIPGIDEQNKSDLSNTNSSENVLSFGKALKSVKTIENDYTGANTSNQGKLVKKISSVSLEKTLKTLEKSVFKWKSLSTNYIEFVEDLYNKLKDVKENEPVRLNWTGLEHLTDAVFGCLLEKNDVPGYKFVIGIVLTGCNQLTDVGIKWMSQCFPKLKEVSLAGCIKVTETGVYNLLENCWDLKSVDLTATGVMILPSQIVGKEVDTAGCPLVSPSEGFVQQYGGLDKMKEPSFKKPDNKNIIKVCVIRPENSTSSMMPLFSSETSNLPVSFKEGFKFDKTDITANIIEFEEGMIDRFVSKRSVVMVTYEPDDNKSVDDTVTWLFSVYCQVLSKKEMEELLAKVVPVVDAARSGLEDISKGGIAELKALNNPPRPVSDVCACLLILKSKRTPPGMLLR